VNASKDQTCESWALKKEKRSKSKLIHNIFKKIILESFPNLEKEIPIQV
jgi:hypothetical protein